jgi:hypothetical protein
MLAKKEHSYRVKLPALIKINPMFFVKSLYYNLNNLLFSQTNTLLLLIKVTTNNKYKV